MYALLIVSPFLHIKAVCSLAFLIVNLSAALVPALLLGLAKRIVPSAASRIDPALDAVYRATVRHDDWWFQRVLGLRWKDPELPLKRDGRYLVITEASAPETRIFFKDLQASDSTVKGLLTDADATYNFEANKGYPGPRHKAALTHMGPTTIHRRSWVFMDHLPWTGVPRYERPDPQGRLFD